MDTNGPALQAYLAVMSEPNPDRLAALEPWLADGIVVAGLVGGATGRANALEALAAPNATRLVTGATWAEPVQEDGETLVEARLAPGMALAGIRLAFSLGGDGRISRIAQQIVAAAPPAPQPLSITPEMKATIDGALTNGTPFVVSYVDAAGKPHISPRGSVQVINERQVGIWARDPAGGLPAGVGANPHVALFYRDPKTRVAITIGGTGRVVKDGPERDHVYANQPDLERNLDGRKRGVAIVVDVDELESAGPAGRVKMVRS